MTLLPSFCFLSTDCVVSGLDIVDNIFTTFLSFHTVAVRFPRWHNSLCPRSSMTTLFNVSGKPRRSIRVVSQAYIFCCRSSSNKETVEKNCHRRFGSFLPAKVCTTEAPLSLPIQLLANLHLTSQHRCQNCRSSL